jgi:hypothetical protein
MVSSLYEMSRDTERERSIEKSLRQAIFFAAINQAGI